MSMNGMVETEVVSRPPANPFPVPELPKDWRVDVVGVDGFRAQKWDGLQVVLSEAIELDGKRWRHVSMSRQTVLPSYHDLKEVKRLFIGDDREAYQIFPSRSRHINIHRFCLHLFACLEGPALPDFTRGTGSI